MRIRRSPTSDQLIVEGDMVLGGTLMLDLVDGFMPSVGQTFELLEFANLSGEFSQIVLSP